MSGVARKLAGKVAVVTAGTQGIGLAISRRLAQDGAKVMLSSRNQENVDSAVKQLRKENLDVEGTVCHVGKKEDRKKLLNETLRTFGGADILVSNAAVNPHIGPAIQISESMYDKIFETNVKASFFLCSEFVPSMEMRGSGSVIFISSLVGYDPKACPNIGVYSISKTALLGMTKVFAHELAPHNIRINCIVPGLVETKFSSFMVATEESRQRYLDNIPLGRIGVPEDISGAAAFFASDDSAFVTGETLVISGGQSGTL